jgi:hypothetical protein
MRIAAAAFGLGLACAGAGCAVTSLIGGMAQNYEYSKQVVVEPSYNGLEQKSVAVLVDLDMTTRYEHPDVEMTIATRVAQLIQRNVPGVKVVSPRSVAEWQFKTRQWSSLSYGEMTKLLNVDRIVHVDVYEYRLHPPGNQWLWEGVCAANVGVAERDGFDPDSLADVYSVEAKFPEVEGLSRESASAANIQAGLLKIFTRNAAWVFYRHLEPKYPDKYDGAIEEGRYDE